MQVQSIFFPLENPVPNMNPSKYWTYAHTVIEDVTIQSFGKEHTNDTINCDENLRMHTLFKWPTYFDWKSICALVLTYRLKFTWTLTLVHDVCLMNIGMKRTYFIQWSFYGIVSWISKEYRCLLLGKHRHLRHFHLTMHATFQINSQTDIFPNSCLPSSSPPVIWLRCLLCH